MAIPQGAYFGGARLLDLAGKNHGTLTNGPTWGGAVGRPGGRGAVVFDGSNDHVLVGNIAAFSIAELTCSAWVRTTSTVARNGIVCKWDSGSGNDRQYLFEINAGGTLRAFVSTDGTFQAGNTVSGATALAANTWYHVAFTTKASGSMIVYLNGVQDGINASAPASIFSGTAPFGIGFADYNVGTVGQPFLGNLDDVRFDSVQKSATDIMALYNDSRQGYPTTLNRIRLPMVNSAGAAPANTKRRDLMLLGVGC